MSQTVLKGLPTLVGSVIAITGVFVPEAQDFVAQHPQLVTALVGLFGAIANFTPTPGRKA
jgi:hypothetical protein